MEIRKSVRGTFCRFFDKNMVHLSDKIDDNHFIFDIKKYQPYKINCKKCLNYLPIKLKMTAFLPGLKVLLSTNKKKHINV